MKLSKHILLDFFKKLLFQNIDLMDLPCQELFIFRENKKYFFKEGKNSKILKRKNYLVYLFLKF